MHTPSEGLKFLDGAEAVERRWLTLKQAAEYLGTTDRAIEAYVLKKKLRCYKPFGRLLFDKFELDFLIKASRK